VAKRSAPPVKAAPKKPKKGEPTDLIPRVAKGGGDQEPREAKSSGKKNGRAAKKRRSSRPIQEVSPLPTPAALLPEVVKDMTKPERFEAESKAKAKPKPEPVSSGKPRLEEPEDALLPSGPRHYLQVGNFQDENLARAILLKWQAMKINGHLESFRLPGGPKEFLVLLGPYPSRDAARKEGLRLRRMNAVEFFMVVEREEEKKEKEKE
jgi:cell division septation protein DedD